MLAWHMNACKASRLRTAQRAGFGNKTKTKQTPPKNKKAKPHTAKIDKQD